MDIKKAFNRLGWRFSQGKAFKPNQNDVDALNAIIENHNKVFFLNQFHARTIC